MRYKVLDNGSAVIVERQPVVVRDALVLTFADAPTGCTAVATTEEATYYRGLNNDGICEFPKGLLAGKISVCLAVLGGDKMVRYTCEGLCAERLEDGGVLVSPDDMDLPLTVARLSVENEELRIMLKGLSDRIGTLETQLDKIVKGHTLL